jgi:hypothetical protein
MGWLNQEGVRFLLQEVMEASHSTTERIKEGPLYGEVAYSLLIRPSHELLLLQPLTTLFL